MRFIAGLDAGLARTVFVFVFDCLRERIAAFAIFVLFLTTICKSSFWLEIRRVTPKYLRCKKVAPEMPIMFMIFVCVMRWALVRMAASVVAAAFSTMVGV